MKPIRPLRVAAVFNSVALLILFVGCCRSVMYSLGTKAGTTFYPVPTQPSPPVVAPTDESRESISGFKSAPTRKGNGVQPPAPKPVKPAPPIPPAE